MEDEKVGAADDGVSVVSPSPWVVGKRVPVDSKWRIESPPRYPGGDVVADHVANVFCEADAHLIAAATDLLAALRDCADDLEAEVRDRYRADSTDGVHPAMLPKFNRDMSTVLAARAALTKATGK